jgi:hypothetical protein
MSEATFGGRELLLVLDADVESDFLRLGLPAESEA